MGLRQNSKTRSTGGGESGANGVMVESKFDRIPPSSTHCGDAPVVVLSINAGKSWVDRADLADWYTGGVDRERLGGVLC